MSSDPAHAIPVDLHSAPEAPSTAPTVTPHARRMLDRYEIIAEIAKGGMGTVYLARLEGAGGFERLMALKLMHEHLAEEEQFVTMLLDEARTAASIHHPNAVGIVDVCASPVGYYLVMNYVDGFSLWQVMTHPALSDRERIRLCTRLVADALHGLHAAHTAKNAKGERLGIVHRDVSPQNVLVGSDGMGRIVDFGIALAASRVATSRPGMLKGKPSYMAPEQARGDVCDGRTDVFSMGIVLWEALVNERLFWAEMDVAVLMQVMDCNIERPESRRAHVPAALADVTMKALAKSPADRYATARDFAVALEKAAEASGLLATTHEVEERIAQLFADELAEKQRAVAGHLSASSGTPVLLQKGQLGTIPKLFSKKPATRELATRTSGVRSRSSQHERASDAALAKTSTATPLPAIDPSPPIPTPVVAAIADAPTPVVVSSAPVAAGPTTARLGWALGVVGVLLALAAVGVTLMSSSEDAPRTSAPPETTPTTAAAATSPAAAPPAPTDEIHSETALEGPGSPVQASADTPDDVGPAVDVPPQVEAPRDATEPSTGATTATPGRSRSRPHATTTASAPPTPAPAPSAETPRTSPALEANPYLTP